MRVDFDYEPQETRDNPTRGGFVILDPERYWLLREGTVKGYWAANDQGTISLTVEYDESNRTFPLVSRKRMHIQAESSEGLVDHDWVWEFNLSDLTSVDKDAFTLAAYGIAEPVSPEQYEQRRRTRLWMIVLANGFIAVAAILWWYSRRRSKSVT